MQTRERTIDKELKLTDRDIQLFQTEKQQALNQVVIAVPIRLMQIRFLENGTLPADISNALIFTQPALDKLRKRIQDVLQEKTTRKKEIADLRVKHKQLHKTIKVKHSAIEVERAKCEEVQMLKLGRIIEPELLEQVQ